MVRRTLRAAAALAGVLALVWFAHAQGVDVSLTVVKVRLVQIGGPAPGTTAHPVADGWIRVRSTQGTRRWTLRTNAVGRATVELPAGSYSFTGRENEGDGFFCRASHRVTVSPAASAARVVVRCIVP